MPDNRCSFSRIAWQELHDLADVHVIKEVDGMYFHCESDARVRHFQPGMKTILSESELRCVATKSLAA